MYPMRSHLFNHKLLSPKQRQDEGTIEAQRSGDSEEAEMITWNIGGSSPRNRTNAMLMCHEDWVRG